MRVMEKKLNITGAMIFISLKDLFFNWQVSHVRAGQKQTQLASVSALVRELHWHRC